MWWHTVTHGNGSEEETGEWSRQPVPFTLPRNMVYPKLLPLMRTPRLPVVDWTDARADINGLVRFAERRNLFSARVPSHFNWPLPETCTAAKRLGSEFDPSPPSSARIKIEWTHNSTPSYALMTCTVTTLPLLQFKDKYLFHRWRQRMIYSGRLTKDFVFFFVCFVYVGPTIAWWSVRDSSGHPPVCSHTLPRPWFPTPS